MISSEACSRVSCIVHVRETLVNGDVVSNAFRSRTTDTSDKSLIDTMMFMQFVFLNNTWT